MIEKFDVVIGNPPYQLENDSPIYHEFIDLSQKIGKTAILINPARFLFKVGKTPKEFNERILKNKHFNVLEFYYDSSQVFSNVDIKGGVCITKYDESKEIGPVGLFLPTKELYPILEKVENVGFKSINEIRNNRPNLTKEVYKDFPNYEFTLNLETNIFVKLPEIFHKEKLDDGEDYVKIHGLIKNKRVERYVKKKYIQENEILDKYKVAIPKANGSGALGEKFSTPLILNKGDRYTRSFLSFGSFDNLEEAENLLKYVKTKFFRLMLGMVKTTQHNVTKEVWRYVPLQDFTSSSDIDWSKSIKEIDQQLYKKYNLDEDDISFVEKNVKVME